jgi:hypothetical protein
LIIAATCDGRFCWKLRNTELVTGDHDFKAVDGEIKIG